MCQALGVHPDKKHQSMNGPSMRDIMRLLNGSEREVVDRERFMRACAFYFVMAAPDAHAKNYSILHNPGGTFRLAPLYDVISVLTYDTAKYGHLAMCVDGEHEWKRIEPKHWEREAQACGFNPTNAAIGRRDCRGGACRCQVCPFRMRSRRCESADAELVAEIAKRCKSLKDEY